MGRIHLESHAVDRHADVLHRPGIRILGYVDASSIGRRLRDAHLSPRSSLPSLTLRLIAWYRTETWKLARMGNGMATGFGSETTASSAYCRFLLSAGSTAPSHVRLPTSLWFQLSYWGSDRTDTSGIIKTFNPAKNRATKRGPFQAGQRPSQRLVLLSSLLHSLTCRREQTVKLTSHMQSEIMVGLPFSPLR